MARWLDILTTIVSVLVAVGGAVFTAALVLEVVARFVFDFSMVFINGLARLLLLWFFFLGAALALRAGNHVGLEMLLGAIDKRLRLILHLLAQGIVIVFLVMLIASSVVLISGSWSFIEPTLGISVVWQYLAVPVGATLMLVYQLEALVLAWRRR